MVALPFLLFSGFIANIENVVSWLKWFQYLSPIRYSLEVFFRAEYEENAFDPGDDLNKYPVKAHNYDVGYTWCFVIMLLISLAARVLAFLFLKLQTINT